MEPNYRRARRTAFGRCCLAFRKLLFFPWDASGYWHNVWLRGFEVSLRFEDFSLDLDRRELRRGGKLLGLEPKVFDLLAFLVQNRERVVTRDELITQVWNGRIVSESALATCINASRSAVNDSGEAQRLIKTLPRKGIRFTGEVQEQELAPQANKPSRGGQPEGLRLPDKPSIAVLPFQNLSSDPEQEY